MRQVIGLLLLGSVMVSCGSNPGTKPELPSIANLAANCGIERSSREPSLATFSAADVKACEIACDQGDPGSCVTLGLAYEKGRGVSRDDEKSFHRYHQACEKKYVRGCSHEAGSQYAGFGTDWDPVKAVEMARRTCDQGDAYGCNVMGRASHDGVGTTKDAVRAAVFFRRACDGGEMAGCVNLGILYSEGEGVVADANTSQVLAQRGCNAGAARGCALVGGGLLGTALHVKDTAGIEKGLRLLEGACREDDVETCHVLGRMYSAKDFGGREFIPENIPLAAQWFAHAEYSGDFPARSALRALGNVARDHLRERCMKDDAIACGIASGWFSSEATSESYGIAKELAERGCVELKSQKSCFLLSAHYARGTNGPQNLDKARELSKNACNAGFAEGCMQMAQLIDLAAPAKSPAGETPFRYIQRACHLGLISSCTAIGRLYTFGTGAEMNRPLGFRLLERSCNDGDGEACHILSDYYFNGWEPAKQDVAWGVQLLERACDNGAADACLNVGIRYLNGDLVPMDDKKGFGFVAQACNRGLERACRVMKSLAAMGWGTKRDIAHGEENLRAFCKDGDVEACGLLGELLFNKDVTSAEGMEKLEKACAGDALRACSTLGQIYLEGIGQTQDLKKAAFYVGRGCTVGEPFACSLLGTLHFQGQGVTASDALARSFQEKACELGSMRGCAALAELHEKGRGVERNGAKAVELYEKACTGDYAAACRRLGEMLLDGKGVPKRDPGTAADKLEKASRLGDTDAINKLLELRADGWVAPRRLEETLELSCFTGHWPACRSLAFLWWAPPANSLIERRPASALRHAEKACKENDLPACGIAARVYAKGADRIPERKLDIDKATRKPTRIIPAQDAITRDEKLALERYKKACGEGASVSFSAASIGIGPKPDARSSVAPVASAEQQNDPASCYEWAQRDKQRAPELLERACRGGYERACAQANKNAGKSAP